MITLKYWNSLTQSTRDNICKALGKGTFGEYHHNFDHDPTGKALKDILGCCNIQPDGTLKVAVTITPKKSPVRKPKAKTATPAPTVSSDMKRWKFRRYTSGDTDGEWVWAHGRTEDEARAEIMSDYWDTQKLVCYGLL